MKKLGFTLAEVLIILAVVGVIAALTLPTLVTKSQNQAMASKLSTVKTSIETALGMMMISENAEDLTETSLYKNKNNLKVFASILGKYYKVVGTGTKSTIYGSQNLYTLQGETTTSALIEDDFLVKAKDGSVLSFNFISPSLEEAETSMNNMEANGYSRSYLIGIMSIDVNGLSKPNKISRDIFLFALSNDGKIQPYGGKWMSVENNFYSVWNVAGHGVSCVNGDFGAAGYGCAARLIDNNYKVDY